MRDLKAPLLIAVPAAITILGIFWFLKKISGDDKKDGKTTKSSGTVPSTETGYTETPGSPNTVKKEGITLTQRKIPETAESVDDAPQVVGSHSLTESERERVREIVDAAIGAGLKEAKGEVMRTGSYDEEKRFVVEEEMTMESVASVQSSVNNNTSNMGYCNTYSSDVEFEKKKNLSQGNFIDSQAIADFFTQDQTTTESSPVPNHYHSTPELISSSSASLTNASPSFPSPPSSSPLGDINNQSAGCHNTVVPSHPISTTKLAVDETVVTSTSTPADLSSPLLSSPSSSLPSNTSDNNISKDSVLDESSVVSDLQVNNALVSSSSSSHNDNLPSSSEDVAPANEGKDSSCMEPNTSTEQKEVAVKTEESSSSSSNNSSSPVCDNNSVGSSDSGRGGSEQDVTTCHTDTLIHFDFNMPSELCGRLIGKKGYNINQLKAKSGANVSLTHNPLSAEFQICQVVGTQAEIDEALRLIRGKFPLEDHPRLTMTPVALTLPKPMEPAAPVIVPDNMQLSLPDGASVEVYVSTIVDAGHVFVQQPTHRTFMSLEKLNFFLNSVYGQDETIPSLPQPIECGVICVCENEGSWYRAMVMTPEDEYGECQVKFVDYGGYTQLPISCIKQIRADFMNLPFQAVECFVANIAPLQGEEYFSTDSTMALSEMSQMKLLQCQVVARNEIGTPYIHLYVVSPESNTATMVNRALVNNGLVRWVEIL